MKVYIQKYIDVTFKTPNQGNEDYPVGMTPDMLLPMDIAEKYGETSVKAGHNQGFTVEFTSHASTEAGVYTGAFDLIAGEHRFSVPVTVEVADIDISQSYGKTYVGMTFFHKMTGEYNNTDAYKKYYDTALNDYKFCMGALPGALDAEMLVKSVLEYWDNPRFTTYTIPYYGSPEASNDQLPMCGVMNSYIKALAKASTPDKLLLEKAIVYSIYLDEPTDDRLDTVREANELFYEAEDSVIADLESEGWFQDKDPDFVDALKKSITHIPMIFTVTHDQLKSGLGSAVNTYCSRMDDYNMASAREDYAAVKEANAERGGETWFYTCMYPVYPQPSHHMDDYLIGARIMRWMQKDYGFDGYLHWSFGAYHYEQSGQEVNIDPYTQSSRFPNTQGDGFMFYPGKKYGVDTFLPSLRLTAFRDGQEDYDMLCVLDEAMRRKEKFYGVQENSFSSDIYVADLYKKLFTGVVYEPDDKSFYEVRKALFDAVLQQSSESNFMGVNKLDKGYSFSDLYVADGYEIEVEGVAKSDMTVSKAGNGNKYSFKLPLSEGVVLKIGVFKDGQKTESYEMFVSDKVYSVSLGADDAMLTTAASSTVTYENGNANIVLTPLSGEDIGMSFRPYVRILGGTIGTSLENADAVSFTLTNTGSERVTVSSRLYSFFEKDLASYVLDPGESVYITLNGMYRYSSEVGSLENAYLELCVENSGAPVNLRLSDLGYTRKGEN